MAVPQVDYKRRVNTAFIETLHIPARKRGVDSEAAKRLAESIKQIGLQIPISIRWTEVNGVELVAGRHRVEAYKLLGETMIPCREELGTDLDAELWEVSENLARAELTGIELEQHRAEWARLIELKRQETEDAKRQAELDLQSKKGEVSVQDGQKPPPKTHHSTGVGRGAGGGRPPGGNSQTARQQGVSPQTLARSRTIVDNLTPEAQAKATELGSPQVALLKAAELEGSAAQIASLEAHAAGVKKQEADDAEAVTEGRFQALLDHYRREPEEVRRRFLDAIKDDLIVNETIEKPVAAPEQSESEATDMEGDEPAVVCAAPGGRCRYSRCEGQCLYEVSSFRVDEEEAPTPPPQPKPRPALPGDALFEDEVAP